ncbi:MAG: hypothetical protein ACQGVK_11135 [Myxococcota bacterium]
MPNPNPLARPTLACLATCLLLFAAGPVAAEEADGQTEERLDAVERAVEVLTREQDRLRTIVAVPEDEELRSVYGLGPAASKVYLKEKGLSIGGYGEWRGRIYTDDNPNDEKNELDALRAVLYTGYKFNDWILFNAEFEFEHAGTGGGGSASTEFMTLDLLAMDELNARVGLVLIPMGFINEIHEPVFFFGNERPEVERRIIPSTWRENGGGVFGELFGRIQYRAYVVNGFDATGFDDNGLRGGRQKGSEALAEHAAFVARVDAELCDGVLIGGSVYTGKSGQNQTVSSSAGSDFNVPDVWTTIWEVHAQVKRAGFSGRALWAQAHLDQAASLNRVLGASGDLDTSMGYGVATRMVGGYGEVAYDVLGLFLDTEMTLEPFYRFEYLDTQDKTANGFKKNDARERLISVVGLSYKPHPQVVLKADWRYINADSSKDIPNEFQLGFGFVF